MDVRIGFQVAPGQCFTCSTPDPTKPVIDTGSDHPGVVRRFRVYICGECILSAAKQLTPYTDVHVVPGVELAGMVADASAAQEYRERAESAEARLRNIAEWAIPASSGGA
jgi:hypothetical protein